MTIREQIISLLDTQCSKGLEKYSHTLDDCDDQKFDWRLMAMEELIDLVQYQTKELIRMERLNKQLTDTLSNFVDKEQLMKAISKL